MYIYTCIYAFTDFVYSDDDDDDEDEDEDEDEDDDDDDDDICIYFCIYLSIKVIVEGLHRDCLEVYRGICM